MNSENLFYGNPQLYERIDEIKYTKFSNEKGDFFYFLNIYSEFYHKLKDKSELEHWIKSHYLSKKTLFQTKELVEEIQEIVKNFKLDVKDKSICYLIETIKLKISYCKNLNDIILSCMITSFCVNLCLSS
jgi:HrpA-like RNA helicase